MGFFSNVTRVVGDLFEEAGAAIGDVVEPLSDQALGPRGQRGQRIGSAIGASIGGAEGAAIGGRLGQAFSEDIKAAPDIAQTQRRERQLAAAERLSQTPTVVEQNDEIEVFFPEDPRTAGFPSRTGDNGTLDFPRTPQQTIGEAGVNVLTEAYDYFFSEDDNQMSGGSGMMMCPPAAPKAFNVNRQTGCVTITRKQQAKLKEAVRMFGGAAVAKNLNISQQLLQQLLLKTFRARRRGISGADLRTVKRVDRQMHSLACALGGISTTSRAVASRKSPPKRSC
jgi:hypothetical protein